VGTVGKYEKRSKLVCKVSAGGDKRLSTSRQKAGSGSYVEVGNTKNYTHVNIQQKAVQREEGERCTIMLETMSVKASTAEGGEGGGSFIRNTGSRCRLSKRMNGVLCVGKCPAFGT